MSPVLWGSRCAPTTNTAGEEVTGSRSHRGCVSLPPRGLLKVTFRSRHGRLLQPVSICSHLRLFQGTLFPQRWWRRFLSVQLHDVQFGAASKIVCRSLPPPSTCPQPLHRPTPTSLGSARLNWPCKYGKRKGAATDNPATKCQDRHPNIKLSR